MQEFTVLLVDNGDPFCEIIADVLEWAYNLNVLIAHTALEAQSLLNNNEINLIILDEMMPIMDSLLFAKWVRSEPAHSQIPIIIIVSANVSLTNRILAFEAGVNGFLEKPFGSSDLEEAISPYLKVKGSGLFDF